MSNELRVWSDQPQTLSATARISASHPTKPKISPNKSIPYKNPPQKSKIPLLLLVPEDHNSMPSDKQLAANRANAQKSTGPKSTAGKQRSSLNALRHGLTGQVVVMPEEDLAAYHHFLTDLTASLDPAGPLETQLAQSYAAFQWRINRAAALDETLLTLGNMEELVANLVIDHPQAHNATSNAKTFRNHSDAFSRLALYSQRLINQAEKVFKQLQQLQADRRQREQREMKDAIAVYHAHKTAGAPFDPRQNGFVLTVAKIEAHLHRENLKKPAYVAEILRRTA
jgi:hypothetical protein